MKLSCFYLIVAVTLIIAATPLSSWAVTIDVNTTIDSSIDGRIRIIDGDMPPTVVDIVESGVITGSTWFDLRDSSVVNFRGGSLDVYPADDDFFYPVFTLRDQSTINVFDGFIGASLAPSMITALDSTTVNIHGGTFDSPDGNSFSARNQSMVNIHGGEFSSPFSVSDNSTVNIFGGDLIFNHSVSRSSTLNVFGGSFTGSDGIDRVFNVHEQGMLNLHGGEFTNVEKLTVTGPDTILNVFGRGLRILDNKLTGTLADGSDVNLRLDLANNPTITLHTVPEPATWFLLLIGLVILIVRRNLG